MKLRSAIILKTENRIYPFYYENNNYQRIKICTYKLVLQEIP